MKKIFKTLFIALLYFASTFFAQAQQWDWVLTAENVNKAPLRTYFTTIAADNIGNLYALSQSVDTVKIGNNILIRPFVTKFNGRGEVIWSKSIGIATTYLSAPNVTFAMCDAANNLYIGGYINNNDANEIDFGNGQKVKKNSNFVAKYSPEGMCLWAKEVFGYTVYGEGYNRYAEIMGSLDQEGNLYVHHTSNKDFITNNIAYQISPKNSTNGVIVKYKTNGEIEWIRKIYDHPAPMFYEKTLLKTFKVDSQDNIICAFEIDQNVNIFGKMHLNNKEREVIVAKVNSSFALQWLKVLPKSLSEVFGLHIDKDNNILVNYVDNSNLELGNLTIKYNPQGSEIWQKRTPKIWYFHDGGREMFPSKSITNNRKMNFFNRKTNSIEFAGVFWQGEKVILDSLVIESKPPDSDYRIGFAITSLKQDGKYHWAFQGASDSYSIRGVAGNSISPILRELTSDGTGNVFILGMYHNSLEINNQIYIANRNPKDYYSPRYFIAKIAQPCPEKPVPISVETQTCKPTKLQVPACTDCRFQWFRNNQILAGATQNSYEAELSGSYSVNISKPTCMLRSEQVAVQVQFPELPAQILGSSKRSFCRQTDTLRAKIVEGVSYQWYRNGAKIGANKPTLPISESGTYAVALQKTDCKVTSFSPVVEIVFEKIEVSILGTLDGDYCENRRLLARLSNVTTSLNGIEYEWKKDGITLPDKTEEIWATESGNYTVTVRKDSCRGTSAIKKVGIIKEKRPVILNQSTIMACDTVTLWVGSTEATVFNWFLNSKYLTKTNVPKLLVKESGNYYVQIGENNCLKFSNIVNVNIFQPPPTQLLQGSAVAFCSKGVLQVANPSSSFLYQWFFGGEPILGATQANLEVNKEGVYFAAISDKQKVCTIFSNKVAVTLNKIKAKLLDNQQLVFCEKGLLRADSIPNTSYEWTFLSALVPKIVSKQATASITESGIYKLKIRQDACVDSLTVEAEVQTFPEKMTVSASSSILCKEKSIDLQATHVANATYSWTLNGNSTSYNTAKISIIALGTYTAFATLKNGCRKQVGQIVIKDFVPETVKLETLTRAANLAEFALFPNPTTGIFTLQTTENQVVTLNISKPNAAWKNITWTINGEKNAAFDNKTSLFPQTEGNYSAWITDANGCSLPPVSATINFPKFVMTEVRLVDVLGRVVRQFSLNDYQIGEKIAVDLSNLPPSVYVLQVQTEKEQRSFRIVKN
jgi:hypothetical protein